MRRIRVKRQLLSTDDTARQDLVVARKRIGELNAACDRREESLKIASNLIYNLKDEIATLKKQSQEYRNESIHQRVRKEQAEKARDTVTQCYDALLIEVGIISEKWYDNHLDETGNILAKERYEDIWEDEEESVA